MRYLNERLLFVILVVLFLLIGGAYGYSIALLSQAEETAQSAIAAAPVVKRVLGTGAGPYYANPFETLDARAITFPVAQLASCRNWEECKNFCDEEENFQACVAWSHSVE